MTAGDAVAGAFLGVILMVLLLWLRQELMERATGREATLIARSRGAPGGDR